MQRREVAQRLGRARRVQVELPAQLLHGGAGIGGPRAGHGGGARAKTAGRAGPLPPRRRGRGGDGDRDTREGRAAVTASRGHPVSPRLPRLQASAHGPFPRTGRGRRGFPCLSRRPAEPGLGHACPCRAGGCPHSPSLLARPRLGPGRGGRSERFQVPVPLETALMDGIHRTEL